MAEKDIVTVVKVKVDATEAIQTLKEITTAANEAADALARLGHDFTIAEAPLRIMIDSKDLAESINKEIK